MMMTAMEMSVVGAVSKLPICHGGWSSERRCKVDWFSVLTSVRHTVLIIEHRVRCRGNRKQITEL